MYIPVADLSPCKGHGNPPKVPQNTVWEPLRKMFSKLPPLRCSVDPSSPGFAQAQVDVVLFGDQFCP